MLGFAIPSVQAERVVNDLLIYGEPQPEPLLGVSVLQVPDQLAEHLWGIQVKEVAAGGAGGPGRRPGRGLSSGGGRQGDPQQCGSAAGPVAAPCGRRDDVDPLAPRRDPDGDAGTDRGRGKMIHSK